VGGWRRLAASYDGAASREATSFRRCNLVAYPYAARTSTISRSPTS